jgi:hypothetical protein
MSSVTEKLNIIKKKQDKSNFCYAAVLQSVVNFYTGQPISQDQICSFYLTNVTDATKGKPAEDGSYKQDPIHYLEHVNMFAETVPLDGGVIPGNIIIKEIDAKRPVIMKVDDAHYVMIYGYKGVLPPKGRISRSMEKQIRFKFLIYDPIKPNDDDNNIDFLAKTYRSNYEPGKGDIDLIINGVYLTKHPMDGGGKKRKRTITKRRKNRRTKRRR